MGLGSRLRAVRHEHELTQAQLASRLGISTSYLNLMENGRRPVSANVLIRLAQEFALDVATFGDEQGEQVLAEVQELLADPIFEGHKIPPREVEELVDECPSLARAMVTMYESLMEGREQLQSLASRMSQGQEALGVAPWRLPSEEVSDFLQRHQNYFPELEAAAEELWRRARLDHTDLYHQLVRHLRDAHNVAVEVSPVDFGDRAVRRYDPDTRTVRLSEVLPTHDLTFQLAHQICLLTRSGALDAAARDERLTSDESRALCRVALANYFAGAVLMPYEDFLATAESCRYDVDLLGHRFRTSFEQTCHRLTTLQRPGHEGIPFHFLRVDIAGNISKRFSASGIQFARFSGACPRWNLVQAFTTPGKIRVQLSKMVGGERFFCIAKTVEKGERGFHAPVAVHSVCLGCRIDHAPKMVYSDGIDLDNADAAVPVGVTCRLCERMDCEQRAFPPLHRCLHIDENVRGFSFYAQVKD